MTGTQQFVSLMCILMTVLAIAFIIMAPSIISAKNRKEP